MIDKTLKNPFQKEMSWSEIKPIITLLSKKGFQVVVSGGAVRDALLKRKPKDIDLATSAKPKDILKLFPSAKGMFAKYAVVFIPLKTTKTLEITSFRKDSIYIDGRRPSSISYGSIEEDAQRRDFTINALFYDPKQEKLIDFVGGLKDLKNKLLRTVGQASDRLEEDHLRVLRALRLAHQLKFQIDKDLQTALLTSKNQLKKISKERIVTELVKMFSAGDLGEAIKSLQKYKLLFFLFPFLKNSLKSKHLKNPFHFWSKNFSFYKEQAFVWILFALPFFYSREKDFQMFLKDFRIPSSHIKKALSYLKAVQTLTNKTCSLTQKLQAFNGQKDQIFELTSFWLESQNSNTLFLKKLLKDFEQRQKGGKLPPPLVKGSDLLKHFPTIQKRKISFFLQQAFEYQMEQTQASKTQVLKNTISKIKKNGL